MDEPDTLAKLPLPSAGKVADSAYLATKSPNASNLIGQTLAARLASLKSANTSTPLSAIAAVGSISALSKHSEHQAKSQRATSLKHKDGLWYALYFPQLKTLSHNQQQHCLNRLAEVAESVSATVSFHPQALVCEIRSSLKYFGGINSIHEKLNAALTPALIEMKLADDFLYAASPTVTASLLLARSGRNTLVYQKQNLRSVLGELELNVLQLNAEQQRRLYNMGIRHLKDIWRLPADGIRKRFGSEFVNTLNKALGKAPEPTKNYLPPPTFSTSYDLPYELENLDRLLPVVDEMLLQLTDFLTRRDLCTGHLIISLLHEKRSSTSIELSLRQPNRQAEHFLLLIETHFNNLTMPAPVIGLKLQVNEFDAFTPHSGSLALEGKVDAETRDSDLSQFMEKLRARLGDSALKNIKHVAEHCPEYASQQFDVVAFTQRSADTVFKHNEIPLSPRPIWLLDPAEQLTLKNSRLYHRGPIVIVSGPERIETCWWSGNDIRRDYYVAREANGSRLWIYHECSGEKRWFLHGYFS